MIGGFTPDDFAIDTAAGTVTCPAGHTVPLAAPGGRYQQRRATFTGLCAACPLRERCTTAKTGRVLTIRPHHHLQAAARHQAATDPRLARRLPPLAPHGRTRRRLARRPRQPPPALPRHRRQRPLAPPPRQFRRKGAGPARKGGSYGDRRGS
ncbi:hypothetical protein HCN51_43595 [Nonomuraea sp. FMUSA5-5]|uniref:Transposase DDE domain-containing protein n=1 Tax=Nonomuraea composti TaxID=2720023 RepID=A0ABX1BIE1_9ACTN|nr:hypothetical protein [Nonomuraea sp. FMUSA5-5]